VTDEWNPNDPDATRVHYDLSAWSFDQQAELASELADAEIPHAWDGAELLVPEEFEAATDSAVAIVEERLGIVDDAEPVDDSAPEPVELADDTLTTEYDLAEWSVDERGTVGNLLINQHLPFKWNAHVLLVATAHEEAVEAILDAVESGEAELMPVIERDELGNEIIIDVDDPVGKLPFETLSTFFLAGERLKRDPLDATGLEQLLKALDVADPERPPYGVEKALWVRTCELAEELADALVGEGEDNDAADGGTATPATGADPGEDDDTVPLGPDEDEAVAVATELHDLLRPYV
jgi:hypothetical protein